MSGSPAPPATIGLFADRLARGGRSTGVGGYAAGTARALSEVSEDYSMLALPESGTRASAFHGLPVAQLPWPRPLALASWSVLRRPRIGRRQSLRLVHVLVPTVPAPADVPLVATVHDLMPLQLPESFPARSRKLFALAIRHIVRTASHIVAVSNATRNELIARGVHPDRVTTVYQGRPLHFEPADAATRRDVLRRRGLFERPFVLFLGEVAHRKDPMALVEAFAEIASSCPDARLVVAGSPGSASQEVSRLVSRLSLQDRVDVTGHIDGAEAASLMQEATAFVLPSKQEGFGLPVLEAMSVGTPVVVSDAGALPEVVSDAGLICRRGDRRALAAALHLVLNDEQARSRLRTSGLSRAAAFSWRRSAESLMSIHRHVLGSG